MLKIGVGPGGGEPGGPNGRIHHEGLPASFVELGMNGLSMHSYTVRAMAPHLNPWGSEKTSTADLKSTLEMEDLINKLPRSWTSTSGKESSSRCR